MIALGVMRSAASWLSDHDASTAREIGNESLPEAIEAIADLIDAAKAANLGLTYLNVKNGLAIDANLVIQLSNAIERVTGGQP